MTTETEKPIFMSYLPAQGLYEAAKVIALTPEIRKHLTDNDPKALEQLEKAIAAADLAIHERAVYHDEIEEARLGCDDELEIDDEPVLSVADGEGVWVSAWIWISTPEPDETEEDEPDETEEDNGQ
jgi:hypothetical protein